MQPTEAIKNRNLEIEAKPQRVTQRRYLTQKLLTAAIDSASGVLTSDERQVLMGLVQEKSYYDIGEDLQLTKARIYQKEREATNKILPFLNIVELRLENERVREENQKLYEENQKLKNQQNPITTRNLHGTPFDLRINDLGLTHRCLKPLKEFGIITIGDLVRLKKVDLVRSGKFRYDVCKQIEEKLNVHGLHLGMDLDYMSDEAFDDHVKRMSEKLGKKTEKINLQEDKSFLSYAAIQILEDVINMAPKLGIPMKPRYMNALIHVLRGKSYNEVAKELGFNADTSRNHALKGIAYLKTIPDYLNQKLEEIALAAQKAAQKENRVYVGDLSENQRLIMNTQLRDVPYCNKNSAVPVLEHYGILTVGDLCSRHRSEIEEIRALRSKMNNVDKILTDLGLTYGMTLQSNEDRKL